MHIIMHNFKTKNLDHLKFWEYLFWLISCDSCHKNMLLESLTIPLKGRTCPSHHLPSHTVGNYCTSRCVYFSRLANSFLLRAMPFCVNLYHMCGKVNLHCLQ